MKKEERSFLLAKPLALGQHFLNSQPFQVVDSQQALNQLLALLGSVVVDVLKVPSFDFFEKLLLVLGAKGIVAL